MTSAPRFDQPDWFSWHSERWGAWFAGLRGRPGVRALEIGSFEGRSALWLLENVLDGPGSWLECVDPYSDEGMDAAKTGTAGDAVYARFRENVLERFPNVLHFRETSLKTLARKLAAGDRERFDLVYVDGSHLAGDVLADAVLAWPLLKIGGFLLFDDFTWKSGRGAEYDPGVAIGSFMTAMRPSLAVLHVGDQVLLSRRA